MEWLPPRITDSDLLDLAGAILQPSPGPQAAILLRQRFFRPGFRWAALIDFAAGQDVLPPLIWALQTRQLLPPPPKNLSPEKRRRFITARLGDAFEDHIARQLDLTRQLHACVAALNQAGITPVILKGARYLLAGAPHWQAARPMRDIDLLIKPGTEAAALSALAGIGYVADAPSGLQSHHLPELRLGGHHGAVELHTEPLSLTSRHFMPAGFVWQHAVPVSLAGGAALVLPPVWQAAHALLHHQASDDGYNQRILALKPLWEFACLADGFDAQDWASLAAYPGINNFLASWCLQAGQIFRLTHTAMPVSAAAGVQAQACFAESMQPDLRRRPRFLARQLRRGFSRDIMALRYGVKPAQVNLRLRARHVWFLLKRYRFALRERFLGRT